MNVRSRAHRSGLLALLACALGIPAPADARDRETHGEYLRRLATRVPRSGLEGRREIVSVALGGLLPEGTPRDKARVMTLHPARDWEVIPHQFDPRSEDGDYLFPPEDRTGPFDPLAASDEILFRAGDTGIRAARTAWPEGVTAGGEIAVRDPETGAAGWAYLFTFDRPPLGDIRAEVRYSAATATTDETIETPSYRVSFSRGRRGRDEGVMNGLWIRTPTAAAAWWRSGRGRSRGPFGPNLLDRVKRRYTGGLRFLPGRDWRLDESRIRSEPRGVLAGPLRVIRRAREHFPLGLWIDARQETLVAFLPDRIVLHDTDRVPGRVRRNVRARRERLAWDFAIPKGAMAYGAHAPAGVFVDGRPSFSEYRLGTESSAWWALAAPGGGAILAIYEGDSPVKPRLFYRDDAVPDQPEATAGSSPAIGWRIDDATGRARIHLLVLDRFPPGGERGPMRAIEKPLDATVSPGLLR